MLNIKTKFNIKFKKINIKRKQHTIIVTITKWLSSDSSSSFKHFEFFHFIITIVQIT